MDLRLPGSVAVRSDQQGMLRLNGSLLGRTEWRQVSLAQPMAIESLAVGRSRLEFRLFGWIPIRRLTVDVVPALRVFPGGQSIGVRLQSQGVMVVAYASITGAGGETRQPAREAGLQVGDVILRINDRQVNGEEDAARLIDDAGQRSRPLNLAVRRDREVLSYQVSPLKDRESGRYRIGLYVRDGAAGVGTLTFYDPRTRRFGALGHVITDVDTNRVIDVRSGEIVQATISDVERGTRSQPGEKIGLLESTAIGTIDKNTQYGIIGTVHQVPDGVLPSEPVPVGLASQVHEGPAEILTVVQGRRVERYQIEIQRVLHQPRPDGKGMVIRITDERLLRRTGGIVQGMSGSPILQDGRLVGEVTHVFVNDPTRGYGVFIEWMLREAGLLFEGAGRTGLGVNRLRPLFCARRGAAARLASNPAVSTIKSHIWWRKETRS